MASTPSHRPRKRRIADASSHSGGNDSVVLPASAAKPRRPAFPLVAFLWPARNAVSGWITLPSILLAVGLYRWTTSLWGYSGFQSPPMHGDFEAQRHWMEVTTNLPISQWYFHDLQWWGLDYPPLTAYHSWLLGQVGKIINPSWFTLYESRGLDDPDLKLFMRSTVLISEGLFYVPSAILCIRHFSRSEMVHRWEGTIALVAFLMQPATILIDHGHFQYNTVMLGLSLASLACMLRGSPVWSCVCFVAALGFKQMALFYAPTVFAFLLGICITPTLNFQRFISIATVTVLSFILLFAPLVLGAVFDSYRGILPDSVPPPPLLSVFPAALRDNSYTYPIILQITQAVHRIFPFARGLFEDKVANFWCALHTFHKLHQYPMATVQRAALGATSAAILPPFLILLFRPRKALLPWALAATSWGFFLCSYQVHEKNVLLPLLPMTLLLSGNGGLSPRIRAWVGLANILGSWTLFPLLKRDELRVPYFVLTLLWAYLLGLPPTTLSLYSADTPGALSFAARLLHLLFYIAMVVWHVLEAFFQPPSEKPDLWVVLNVLIGAAGFGVCYLWTLWMLVERSGLLARTVSQRRDSKNKVKTR